MVLLTDPYGQTSNNFFQHIHLDSFCKEKGICFFNPFLRKAYSDYPGLKGNLLQEIMYSIILGLRKSGFLSLLRKKQFDIDDPIHQAVITNNKILLCKGWLFRSFDTTIKFRKYYQNLFDPKIDKRYYKDTFLKKSFSDEVLIGVHIRRGDYKYFTNGVYFYNDNVYIDKIHQLLSCLNGKSHKVLLFSDDKTLNIKEFKESFNEVYISNGSETIDHYLMSQCDYLIGPPSTFSLWASYIGETPFFHIENAEDIVSLEKFRICNG